MRALIVDDERLARWELRALLKPYSYIDVVGEAQSVAEAHDFLQAAQVDVVFLDIHLGNQSGFEVLPLVGDCRVVFVTAFDTHAVKAFECSAVDYLLKPVEPKRLEQTLSRLGVANKALLQPPDRLSTADWVFGPIGTSHGFIKVEQIRCVDAEGDYTRLWLADGQSSLMLRSLREWQRKLPEPQYLRVHRSAIVNLAFVRQIKGNVRSGYIADVDGVPHPVPISRRYASRVRARLR